MDFCSATKRYLFVCLFVVTRPEGTHDRFIAEINPTPTLYNVQNVHVYNSSRRRSHAPPGLGQNPLGVP
jgi:hypothetical protein